MSIIFIYYVSFPLNVFSVNLGLLLLIDVLFPWVVIVIFHKTRIFEAIQVFHDDLCHHEHNYQKGVKSAQI